MSDLDSLKKTPLFNLHQELGGQMVEFAGYAMPVRYPLGIMAEHNHTREKAGLFDVSHMGQSFVHGVAGADPAAGLEAVMPGLLTALKPGKMRYTLLLNEKGGIEDDLMVTRTHDVDGTIYMVVNAATKEQDYDYLESKLSDKISIEPLEDHALLALQGPAAESVLAALAPDVANLGFMEATSVTLEGVVCWVSRSGYTGEDGYEISIPNGEAEALARRLLAHPDVEAIGLGARDSLRLEAGLCLSGHDFGADVTPVEASLQFALSKKRLEDGDYAGFSTIDAQLKGGVERVRVGLVGEGRAPAREGAVILDTDGNEIGTVTSGGFGPTYGGPVAMGFVPPAFAQVDTQVQFLVRGKAYLARVAALPLVPQRYKRKAAQA